MKQYLLPLLLLATTLQALPLYAQNKGITIPKHGDQYAKYVQQLESGDTNIDYTDFRESYLNSKQKSEKDIIAFSDLKEQVYKAAHANEFQEVIKYTQAMLSIDYTNMFAHKFLQQTYRILEDTANYKKYHDIEFGLLNSIVNSGDGKTCATGWHVTQIEEEYFILGMIEAQFKGQGTTSGGDNKCDAMNVVVDGEERTYYFEVNKIFEQYRKELKD